MHGPDVGITDVLSNIFLVVMAVSLGTILALIVMPEIAPDEQDQTSIAVETGGWDEDAGVLTTLALVHEGGDPVFLETATLHLVVDGVQQPFDLSAYVGALGETWALGERICLSGEAAGCDTLALACDAELTELRLVSKPVERGASQATVGWTGLVAATGPSC